MGVVQANNELKELQAREEKEIDRVLRILSGECAAQRENILYDYDLLVQLDTIFARAQLSYAMDAGRPQVRKKGGIDLLLTHSPAAGLNDNTDHAHKGFECFNDLMDEYEPQWFVHGHVHLNYDAKLPRVCTRGKTTVINATERYVFEIPDPDPVEERKTLWQMLGF